MGGKRDLELWRKRDSFTIECKVLEDWETFYTHFTTWRRHTPANPPLNKKQRPKNRTQVRDHQCSSQTPETATGLEEHLQLARKIKVMKEQGSKDERSIVKIWEFFKVIGSPRAPAADGGSRPRVFGEGAGP